MVSLHALDKIYHSLKYSYAHVVFRAPDHFFLGRNYHDGYKGRFAGTALFVLEQFHCKHLSACGQASTISLRYVVGSGAWWREEMGISKYNLLPVQVILTWT